VAEDLGTWPPEQAMVLVEVLQGAGLTPDAKRTRDGVRVSVPAEESDDAHRQLVEHMDDIARAAKQPRPPSTGARRRPRPVKGADNPQPKDPQQLASERMLRIAKPLGLLLVALLLFAVLRNPLVVAVALGALIYILGRRAQQRGEDGGDGRR
jgi:hypothetical protein